MENISIFIFVATFDTLQKRELAKKGKRSDREIQIDVGQTKRERKRWIDRQSERERERERERKRD